MGGCRGYVLSEGNQSQRTNTARCHSARSLEGPHSLRQEVAGGAGTGGGWEYFMGTVAQLCQVEKLWMGCNISSCGNTAKRSLRL